MKKPVFVRDGLCILAGATRLELATFPSGLTGRSNQGIYKLFTFSLLNLLLSCHCPRSVRVFLKMDQIPWPLALGVVHFTLIVTLNPEV